MAYRIKHSWLNSIEYTNHGLQTTNFGLIEYTKSHQALYYYSKGYSNEYFLSIEWQHWVFCGRIAMSRVGQYCQMGSVGVRNSGES